MNENRGKRPDVEYDAPDELHTEADGDEPLSKSEADVAGMIKTDIVYGDSSIDPNADDRSDLNRPAQDEHF